MPQLFLDQLDDELLYERMESFAGGMDAFTKSTLLEPAQYQLGQNVVVPDNFIIRTRPGADRLGPFPAPLRRITTEDEVGILTEGGDSLITEGGFLTFTAGPIPIYDLSP